mgnify:CR=1 FL=1
MQVKKLTELDVRGKKVFIRADLNVPQDDAGNITEDTRIRASLPSIQYCLDNGAAVMVTSHLGRPTEGTVGPDDTLAPVAVRLGQLLHRPVRLAADWVEGGWDIGQTVEFAKELKKRNVDWIDASSGGVSPLQKIPLGPGYQVPFAQAIKQATGIVTMAVGLITEAKQAEEIVASGKADMVALARGMLYDPRWGWHAAAELGGEVSAPPQYWRSQPSTQKALFGTTSFGTR